MKNYKCVDSANFKFKQKGNAVLSKKEKDEPKGEKKDYLKQLFVSPILFCVQMNNERNLMSYILRRWSKK